MRKSSGNAYSNVDISRYVSLMITYSKDVCLLTFLMGSEPSPELFNFSLLFNSTPLSGVDGTARYPSDEDRLSLDNALAGLLAGRGNTRDILKPSLPRLPVDVNVPCGNKIIKYCRVWKITRERRLY